MLKLNQDNLISDLATDQAEFKDLRVAFVSDAIRSRNGVGTYYQDLVSHLSDRIGTLELIAPSGTAPDPYQGFSFAIPGDHTQRLYFPRYRKLVRRLRDISPHLIVFPTIGPYTLLCIPYARRMGIPICVGRHTDFEKLAMIYFHRFLVPVCQPILRMLTSGVMWSADSVITNDVNDQQSLAQRDDVHLVGTTISKLFLDSPSTPPRPGMKRIVFIGRLGPEKNINKLLEAASQLPDLQFTIGGDGPLRDQVESAASELANLKYLGWLSRDEVVRAIDDADMLILPSVLESFGSVALEAMARGRNVLVSRNCGIKNWPRLAEQLFYWENDESLTRAIVRVSETPADERHEKAFGGREAAIQITNSAIDDWLAVFRDVTERKPVPSLSFNP